MAALTVNPMGESVCTLGSSRHSWACGMYHVWEWALGLGLFLSWFSFGASELGSPGVSGTSALNVTVRCLVRGLGASCHCAVVWNTQHTCLKSPSRISQACCAFWRPTSFTWALELSSPVPPAVSKSQEVLVLMRSWGMPRLKLPLVLFQKSFN